MATQIISQAIIRRPEDPSVQLSIVRAEIDRQNAIRSAQQEEAVKSLRKELEANTHYMQQVTHSRNRLLAERKAKYAKRMRRTAGSITLGDIADAIGKPLLVAWAMFWLAGEKLGLWRLRTGSEKKTAPIPTPLGVRLYFAVGTLASIYFWYVAATKVIAYIHYANG